MGTNIIDLIEYNGLNSCKNSNIPNFNQINVDYKFCIPTAKPDIEQIVKVWANACIVKQTVVRTPKGVSLEGQSVTGFKLLIVGDMNLKIEYVANEPTQSVHTAHTTAPFCGYVVLPANYNCNAITTANVLIEDIYANQVDLRCINTNITMMLTAHLC